MTLAMRKMRLSSHVAANPMACGKTVASPDRATPCSASFHQLYGGTPSRSMPGATSFISRTFSSRVMRETRSAARCSNDRLVSRYAGEGCCASA
jgi:hypothetical protein